VIKILTPILGMIVSVLTFELASANIWISSYFYVAINFAN